jgi:hypothetical protein
MIWLRRQIADVAPRAASHVASPLTLSPQGHFMFHVRRLETAPTVAKSPFGDWF